MKKLVLGSVFMLFSHISFGQKQLPRIENDTLYTISGFKMYNGQVLTVPPINGQFRYVKGMTHGMEKVTSFTILKMGKIHVSSLQNSEDRHNHLGDEVVYIIVKAKVTFKDGSTDKGNFYMNFESAVNPKNGLPAEIIIP